MAEVRTSCKDERPPTLSPTNQRPVALTMTLTPIITMVMIPPTPTSHLLEATGSQVLEHQLPCLWVRATS